MKFEFLVILFSIILIPGCVSQQLPNDWEPLSVVTDSCSHISGRYSNEGQEADGTKLFLAKWLYPNHLARRAITVEEQKRFYRLNEHTRKANEVELIVSANQEVHIQIFGEGFTEKWTVGEQERNITCSEGILTIDLSGFEGADIFLGYGSRNLELHTTTNALLIRRRESVAGTGFLVIPLITYEKLWGKFLRTENEYLGSE